MFIKTLLIISILLFSIEAMAKTFLVNQTLTHRKYSTIERVQDNFLYKEFTQNNGEFQEKIDQKNFLSEKDALNYLKSKHRFYLSVNKLDFWKIAKTTEDKGLFGKKHSNIWEAKNRWNMDWEYKYAQWLESEVAVDFYAKRKISTDCADALVGLRWIFARINSLPVANTLADSGNLFGQYSMNKKWNKLSKADNWYEDEVFMAALSYVMDLSSTRTVIQDGYPIKLTSDSLIAGTYFITLNDHGGHAKIVSKTNYSNPTELPVYTYASTSPRAIRNLALEVMVDQEWPTKGIKELLAFRWPVVNKDDEWVLTPSNAHPNYSVEEFDVSLREQFPAFISYVLFKTKGSFDPINLVKVGVEDIKRYIQQRIEVVNSGYDYCSKNKCPTNSEAYDEWSTPSRDAKLLKKYIDIDNLVSAFEYLSPGLTEFWLSQLRDNSVTIEGINLKLSSIRYLFENNFYSIDPNISPKDRWGINGKTVLKTWFEKTISQLNDREEKIKNQGMCADNCDPRSNEWISKNTYTIDKELNQTLVQIKAYCNVISLNQCQIDGAETLNRPITLNNKILPFGTWLNTITKFNSDPRSSIDRRWGELPINEKIIELPYFDIVTVAKNGSALLDFKKIWNLNEGRMIFESNEKINLASDGTFYSITDNDIKYSRLVNGQLLPFVSVIDNDRVLKDNPGRLISYTEVEGRGIFRKSLKDSILAFRIKEGKLEFINEYSGSSTQLKSLLFMAQSNTVASFADLDLTSIAEIDFTNLNLKNVNKLKLIDYSYPYVLADYDDQEWAIHFPVLINLSSKQVQRIKLPDILNYKLAFGSAKQFKAIVQYNLNDELPSLNAFKFDLNGDVEKYSLSNSLISAVELNSKLYILEGTGNQWGHQQKSLKVWGDDFKVIVADLDEAALFDHYLYSVRNNKGQISDLGSKAIVALPDNIEIEKELVKSSSVQFLSYRLNTSYGEYYQMGGVINIEGLGGKSTEEFIPEISIYPSLNKENLIDERWRNNFKDSFIGNGTLISTGKNSAFWWKVAQ